MRKNIAMKYDTSISPIDENGITWAESFRIAGRAKRLRERCGLTQAEAARKIGNISEGYISKLETGKRKFTLAILYKLAAAYETDVSEFLGSTEIGDAGSYKKQMATKIYESMNKEMRDSWSTIGSMLLDLYQKGFDDGRGSVDGRLRSAAADESSRYD